MKLGVVDLIFLVGSTAMSAIIGLYFSNKNKSVEAFMLGDRKMPVIPVAVSLMTSCMSGLSLLGSSSELYYQGPTYAFVVVSMFLCGPITAYTILPVFYRMNELSLYKYLEKRYGPSVKYAVTTIFMIQMVLYNSVVLYLPAMALEAILDVSRTYSILAIGLLGVLYSSIGGLKAVVWTDFLQAALMYLSVLLVGAMGTYDAGGFGQVFRNAESGGRLDMDGFFNLDLTTRHTLLGVLTGSTLKHVYLMGANQVQIQRALALPSLHQSQLSFLFCSLFTALISALSTYMGMVLYSAYRSCDPFLAGEIPRRDAVVVHYVATRLARLPGLRGLFVAGLFSATLSNLSSFSNSMAALTLEDFVNPALKRLGREPLSCRTSTWTAKSLVVLFGSICLVTAYLIEHANSRLLQATVTMGGAVGGPFMAVFALGLFSRSANTAGVLTGLAVSLALGSYVTVNQVFLSPPLKPLMSVRYDEQCARVFNMTLDPSLLSPVEPPVQPVEQPFSVAAISYMTLPLLQFLLTLLIASAVSLTTGGLNQQVDERYLVTALHKKTCNDNHAPSGYSLRSSTDSSLQRKRKLGVGCQEMNKV